MAYFSREENKKYIIENLKFRKNTMGWWEVSFTCADGFCYTIADSGTGRAVKTKLRDEIVDRVLDQFEHPIQKVSGKSVKSSCKSR